VQLAAQQAAEEAARAERLHAVSAGGTRTCTCHAACAHVALYCECRRCAELLSRSVAARVA
jgi:hypothetical protein